MSVDLIISNAKVATLDAADTVAEAVAVTGEYITAVGKSADIAALADPDTQRIDVGGNLVVPGLIDGHAHMDREGLKETLPSFAGCRSIKDVCDRISDLAARTPKGEWIVTMPIGEPPFYEGVPGSLAEGRFPNRDDLDRAAPDHPVYIRAIWGHWRNTLPLVSVANSRALAIAGIDRNTLPPVASIQIEKAPATGEPTGCLYEFVYKPLVEKTLMACIPQFSLQDRIAGLRRSMQVYNGYGTTSVFEGHGIAGEVLAAYQDLRAQGPMPVRANLMFSPAWPGVGAGDVKDLLVDWGRWLGGRGLGDQYLRMAGIYAESDYSEENRLRAQCGPYTGWAGFNFDSALPKEIMIEMMVEAARAGIRVGSFDPGILELFEQVNAHAPIDGQRWIIEHIGMLNGDEIKRVRDLGLVLQAYTMKWIWQDGEDLRAQHGDAGAGQVVPMRDLIDAGVHVSLATDNVPPSLFVPMSHVITRRTETGTEPLAPEQCITRLEALAAASREGAWLSFEENQKGTIEVGKYADLAVLSEDLLTVEEDRIADITAEKVVVGGELVLPTP